MTETSEQNLLSMDEAIEVLKTTRPTFYRWLRSGRIKGMKVGRQWRFYADDLERFIKGEGPRVDLPVTIRPLIDKLHQEIQKVSKQNSISLTDDLESDDAEQVCELMLELSIRPAICI
jgi:excisionase family DNA binding protein